ncbi:MAG: dethiobiotin synthase [Proteobacteria bacterium]|nr:dethiobiotin synthase [Pseudomonadota bacterium]
MRALFVAGTGTDVGKTWVASALIRALSRRGRSVDALKPVVSGFDPAAPEGSDPAVLLAALGRPVTPDEIARIAPLQYRAPQSPPLAARLQGEHLDFEAVTGACRARLARPDADWLLIESAGGVMSPVSDTETCLDLARALGLPTLLVGGSYLGAISHMLTAVEAVRNRGLPIAALVVSESAESSAPLDETVTAISAFAGLPSVTAPRADPSFADALARSLELSPSPA